MGGSGFFSEGIPALGRGQVSPGVRRAGHAAGSVPGRTLPPAGALHAVLRFRITPASGRRSADEPCPVRLSPLWPLAARGRTSSLLPAGPARDKGHSALFIRSPASLR